MATKKQQIKQKIIALTVIVFMFSMIYNTIDTRNVFAAVNNTTLTQNFAVGSLAITAPTSAGFNVLNIGQALNSKANLSVVNVQDYRGSGVGWGVTGNITSQFQATNAGYNYVPNTSVAWDPTTATLSTPDSSNLIGNLRGTAGFFGGAVKNLFAFNANNGMGNYQLSGTELNIVYNGRADQAAGSYQATLELTVT